MPRADSPLPTRARPLQSTRSLLRCLSRSLSPRREGSLLHQESQCPRRHRRPSGSGRLARPEGGACSVVRTTLRRARPGHSSGVRRCVGATVVRGRRVPQVQVRGRLARRRPQIRPRREAPRSGSFPTAQRGNGRVHGGQHDPGRGISRSQASVPPCSMQMTSYGDSWRRLRIL